MPADAGTLEQDTLFGRFCRFHSGFGTVTVTGEGAALALGRPGSTGVPAEENHPVAEITGFLRGDGLAQLPLHLDRVLGPVGDAKPTGDADAVGVAYVCRLTEHIS